MRVVLQVPLHGVDEVPARQEDKDGAGHLQRLDVLQQSLHQLKGRLLLVDLRHGVLGLRRVLGATDGIAVGLWRRGRRMQSDCRGQG